MCTASGGRTWTCRWPPTTVRRLATKFFVNGEEPTRRIVTEGGYRIQGTLAHRIKVVDPGTGQWVWKRLAEVGRG